MSNLAQQFNDMDETHLAMSDPIELAKYIVELREETEQQFQNGFDAGREEYQVDQEFLDEKDEEIEGLRKKLDIGTEEHMADTAKLNAFYKKKVEENEKLEQKIRLLSLAEVGYNEENHHIKETLATAVASRLSTWFPDELLSEEDGFAEDGDMSKLTGDQLVNMIDEYVKYCGGYNKSE